MLRTSTRLALPTTLLLAFALGGCEEMKVDDTSTPTGATTGTATGTPTGTGTGTGTGSGTGTGTGTGTTAPIGVFGLNYEYVGPGEDYFDLTANGIPPFSFSRHSMQVVNQTGADVTIDSFTLTPQTGVMDHEWQLVDPSSSAILPLDLTGTVIPAYGAVDFDIYFYPGQSGLRVEDALITYDGGSTYPFTITGRGRDALGFFDAGVNVFEKVHGDPAEDTLSGGADGDGAGAMFYSGNVNGWSDGFSENIVVSRLDANGTLAWQKEWSESYEQLQPDSGQNAETGGGAESLDYDSGFVYAVGHRSQSSFNSAFQSLVMKVDATTGAMDWAVGFSPDDVNPPSLAWQTSHAYAVDASLSDRVIVTGTSFGDAEVLLFALSKTDGTLLWSKQIEVAAGYNDRGYTVRVDGSGNAWIGGLTNGRGLLARVTGVDGSSPAMDWVQEWDMGVGSNINSIDLDAAGNAYLSLDRRGLPTYLSVARVEPSGAMTWAKTWDDLNSGDNNNPHVVRVDSANNHVYLGGRVAVETADTQFGEAFLMRLATPDGAYDWGAMYYTGKGAEEVLEHRVKGIVFDGSGDLQLLVQSYSANLNFEHYWGYWYNLMDNPLADLTLGEDPGDGAAMLVDYAPTVTDLTATADFHDTDSAYNGVNVATVFPIDTTSIWQDPPAAVTFEDSTVRQGSAPDGDNTLMHLDLF